MSAVLHVISDRTRHNLPLLQALTESAKGGADFIQVREKKAPAAETYALVQQLKEALQMNHTAAQILVNDRVDIALSANIGGVHLAGKSLPIDVVARLRASMGWNGLIGCSVHALDEALKAESSGADYVTFGHVFASESHPGIPPRGLYALRRVVEHLSIPVIAIGGVDHTNLEAVLETGCSGVAVIGAVLNTADPMHAVKRFKAIMDKSSSLPKVPFQRVSRER